MAAVMGEADPGRPPLTPEQRQAVRAFAGAAAVGNGHAFSLRDLAGDVLALLDENEALRRLVRLIASLDPPFVWIEDGRSLFVGEPNGTVERFEYVDPTLAALLAEATREEPDQ